MLMLNHYFIDNLFCKVIAFQMNSNLNWFINILVSNTISFKQTLPNQHGSTQRSRALQDPVLISHIQQPSVGQDYRVSLQLASSFKTTSAHGQPALSSIQQYFSTVSVSRHGIVSVFYNPFQLFFYLASYAIYLAALPDYTIGTTLIVLHISHTTQHDAIYYKFYAQ